MSNVKDAKHRRSLVSAQARAGRRKLWPVKGQLGSAGIVFGSVAREQASSGSDLDLLVIAKDRSRAAEEFSNLGQIVIRRFGLHLDVKILSPDQLKKSKAAYLKTALAEGRAIGPTAIKKTKAPDRE